MMTWPRDAGRANEPNGNVYHQCGEVIKFMAEINSNLLEVEPLMNILKSYWLKAKISEKKLLHLEMIVTELVNNSIIHGNYCNSEKKVWVTQEINEGQVLIQIEDQGEGFDYQQWLTKELQLLADSGRGIYLARTIANSIKYEKNGAKVSIILSVY